MLSPTRREFIKATAFLAASAGLPNLAQSETGASLPKLNVFSKHLQFLNYEEMAQAAKSIGFDGVDLTVRPGGHVEPENVRTDLPRAVEACQAVGLETPMMTTAIDDANDPIDQQVLKTASKLGVSRYRMNWLKYDRERSMHESLAAHQKSIQKLSMLNQELGMIGCYQNHAGTLVGASLWEVWEILKGSDPDHFGAQYDIRHATVEGGLSWTNGFRIVKERIKTIAIKDFRWVRENGRTRIVNTPLGEGMVNFSQYFKLLKQAEIQVPISLHLEYDLGGAEKGKHKITKAPEVVFEAMSQDIATFKRLWASA